MSFLPSRAQNVGTFGERQAAKLSELHPFGQLELSGA